MIYKVIATDEELEWIGIDKDFLSERVVKLKEYGCGRRWEVYSQKFWEGIYVAYAYSIPKDYLELIK